MKAFLASLETKHIPLLFLTLLFSKCLFQGASWPDIAFLVVIGGIASFYEFKNADKKMQVLHARFDATDKVLTEALKKIEALNSYITTNNLRNMQRTNMMK